MCKQNLKGKSSTRSWVASAIKDNKKCFYKYIDKKRRGKENLHCLLDIRANRVTKDEEKVDVFNVT